MSDNDALNSKAVKLLREALTKDPDNWTQRKELAQLLYNQGKTREAADLVWNAPEIPSIDLELGFAVKVLAKGAPRKAIRLLSSIQENNEGKPAQNLGLANALLHYGMVMEAARFYGAAVAQSSDLASADLEHFLLWTDDNEKIWGDFDNEKPVLGELPWMKRNAKEAAQLAKTMSGHTTPIKIPNLQEVNAEKVVHDMYVQSSIRGAEATPPPAVSIPMDRVNPKDVMVDAQLGAAQPTAPAPAAPASQAAKPLMPAPSTPRPVTPGLPKAKPLLTPGGGVSNRTEAVPNLVKPKLPPVKKSTDK